MKYLVALLLIFLQLSWNCGTPRTPGQVYLSSALDTMKKYSVNRNEIDWAELRSKIEKQSENITTIQEAYPMIVYALSLLHDNHSFFLPADQVTARTKDTTPIYKEYFRKEVINNSIGYIKVSRISGSDSLCLKYAQIYQEMIQELDIQGIKSWIIDLRNNSGGNMWPMLAGLGPVLGNGIAGYFVGPDSNYFPWSYSNGRVKLNDFVRLEVDSPYQLKYTPSRVAILINGNTASSGEAIAIAFKGYNNTRFFGEPTAGVSTANKGIRLMDGSMIYLTVYKFTDRNKVIYGKEVLPDERISDTQKALSRAIEWIETGN